MVIPSTSENVMRVWQQVRIEASSVVLLGLKMNACWEDCSQKTVVGQAFHCLKQGKAGVLTGNAYVPWVNPAFRLCKDQNVSAHTALLVV